MTYCPIYTIGYGGRDLEDFVALLGRHQIRYLIDVRPHPASRFYPDFNMEPLRARMQEAGIQYVFMGNTLGGRPLDKKGYVEGHVDYERLRHTPYFQAGMRRLRDALRQGLRVALMCAEARPEQCHRSRLVGVSLAEDAIEVIHIDKDDNPVSQEEVMLRLIDNQPSLFGNDYRHLTSRRRYQAPTNGEPGDEVEEGGEEAAG